MNYMNASPRDAMTCRFNSCMKASQIEVSLSDQQAQCLTFSPADDAQGQRHKKSPSCPGGVFAVSKASYTSTGSVYSP